MERSQYYTIIEKGSRNKTENYRPVEYVVKHLFITRGVDPVLKVGGTQDQFIYTYM